MPDFAGCGNERTNPTTHHTHFLFFHPAAPAVSDSRLVSVWALSNYCFLPLISTDWELQQRVANVSRTSNFPLTASLFFVSSVSSCTYLTINDCDETYCHIELTPPPLSTSVQTTNEQHGFREPAQADHGHALQSRSMVLLWHAYPYIIVTWWCLFTIIIIV